MQAGDGVTVLRCIIQLIELDEQTLTLQPLINPVTTNLMEVTLSLLQDTVFKQNVCLIKST